MAGAILDPGSAIHGRSPVHQQPACRQAGTQEYERVDIEDLQQQIDRYHPLE